MLAALTLAFASRPPAAGGALLGLGLGLLQIQNLTQFSRVGARLGHGRVPASAPWPVLPAVCRGLLGGTLGQWIGLQKVFLVFIPLFLWLVLYQSQARAAVRHGRLTAWPGLSVTGSDPPDRSQGAGRAGECPPDRPRPG